MHGRRDGCTCNRLVCPATEASFSPPLPRRIVIVIPVLRRGAVVVCRLPSIDRARADTGGAAGTASHAANAVHRDGIRGAAPTDLPEIYRPTEDLSRWTFIFDSKLRELDRVPKRDSDRFKEIVYDPVISRVR
ncbi:MAG: hypothetical protein IPF82_15755 [Blastocatellia bacterium]|nr:hypothetical protein [Blastocatellia bacterium]